MSLIPLDVLASLDADSRIRLGYGPVSTRNNVTGSWREHPLRSPQHCGGVVHDRLTVCHVVPLPVYRFSALLSAAPSKRIITPTSTDMQTTMGSSLITSSREPCFKAAM